MTIDRTALRRLSKLPLCEVSYRMAAEVPGLLDELAAAEDGAANGALAVVELSDQIANLKLELDAKDRRIAELEAACQSVRSGAAEAVAAYDAQVARIAELEAELGHTETAYEEMRKDLELRLSIATELNVGDRKRIAELEAGLATIRADLLSLKANNDGASPATCERIMKKVDDLLPSEET